MDFDRTIAETSESSAGGIDVEGASALAVDVVFGERGLDFFERELNGLQEREPEELTALIMREMGWEAEGVDGNTVTDLFIQAKLSHLMREVSPVWPVLTPGVREFLSAIRIGKIPADIGIVSSGHEDFIKKVLRIHGIETPSIIVTNDTLRRRSNEYAPSRLKPNPYRIALAHQKWLRQRDEIGDKEYVVNWDAKNFGKEGMVYIGDALKDSELASRSKIPFVFVPFSGEHFTPDPEKGQVQVKDFRELTQKLTQNRERMIYGASMSEVLIGKPYGEVFKKPVEGELYRQKF